MSPRRKALVLGFDNGSFLSVVRSFGRRGIEVHIAWCPREAPAARSQYVARAHSLPRPGPDDRWIDAFVELLEAERFDLVVPTNDPTLIPLQMARARLESSGRLYLLGDHAFRTAFDKVATRELAVRHGAPVAPGAIVALAAEIDFALRDRSYPLIIKPPASFHVDDLEQRNSVVRVYDPDAARSAILERLTLGRVIVEENVIGPGWGVEVLAHDGKILLSQQHQRLHEPLHGGASSYRRTVPRDPGVMAVVATLVRELEYTGVAMFEFKGDLAGDGWVLIEINGRFWGSLPLSLAAGIDFPYALWELLVEGETSQPDEYRTGVYARNLKRDLKWLWLNLRSDRRDPVLCTVPLPGVAAELTHVVSGREHIDQFTRDDMAPGLAEFDQLRVAAGDRLGTWLMACPPLRRRRRRRARRALANARTVLFVCHGNICRSPFAAGVARVVLPDGVTVLSAGTSDAGGRLSPSIARRVAREYEIDLNAHVSRPLDDRLVEQADAIFVFDSDNRGEVGRRFPRARRKLHLLGSLDGRRLIVEDPINGDAAAFRKVFGRISEALGESGQVRALSEPPASS